jgi:hypothetical protein
METTVSSLLQAEAHKHRKLASDLLALLEAAKAEHPDAMLVMCLASITMMVFYAILTPYHRLVSAPTMTIGQLQEGMQKFGQELDKIRTGNEILNCIFYKFL